MVSNIEIIKHFAKMRYGLNLSVVENSGFYQLYQDGKVIFSGSYNEVWTFFDKTFLYSGFSNNNTVNLGFVKLRF